jgi:hypothetical protein
MPPLARLRRWASLVLRRRAFRRFGALTAGGLVVGIGRTVLDGFSWAILAGSNGEFQASIVFTKG